jgi:hypothetical protein
MDRLTLKNGRPLTVAEQQQEEQRLRYLFADSARLEVFQKEQLSRKERLRTLVAAFPQAFSCQYDGMTAENSPRGLIRLRFHPNPTFASYIQALFPSLEGYVDNGK